MRVCESAVTIVAGWMMSVRCKAVIMRGVLYRSVERKIIHKCWRLADIW